MPYSKYVGYCSALQNFLHILPCILVILFVTVKNYHVCFSKAFVKHPRHWELLDLQIHRQLFEVISFHLHVRKLETQRREVMSSLNPEQLVAEPGRTFFYLSLLKNLSYHTEKQRIFLILIH